MSERRLEYSVASMLRPEHRFEQYIGTANRRRRWRDGEHEALFAHSIAIALLDDPDTVDQLPSQVEAAAGGNGRKRPAPVRRELHFASVFK